MPAAARRHSPAWALDARILAAHARLAQAERDLALLLAELAEQRHFLELGFASVADYAQVRLQLEPRKTRALLRIGRALPELPGLERALASGAIGWTKARELLTVVTPQTEQAWIDLAGQTTSRELERAVAAHRPGEAPDHERATLASKPVRMSFTMEPAEAEQLRTTLAALRASAGVSRDEIDDGALLAQLAGRVLEELEGPEAPTGERFRIVIEHCPACGRTTSAGAEPTEAHVGQALCDAEILDMRPGPRRGHISRAIPPATRRAVLQRDQHRCQVPGCSNRLWLDLHHLDYHSRGGGHAEHNLVTLCSVHHRVLHEGLLGIEREGGGLMFRFGDGRVVGGRGLGELSSGSWRGEASVMAVTSRPVPQPLSSGACSRLTHVGPREGPPIRLRP